MRIPIAAASLTIVLAMATAAAASEGSRPLGSQDPSAAAPPPVEIVVWHSYRGAEKAALEKVASLFNRANQGVRAALVYVPFDALADRITAAVPLGKGPDLFIYAQDRLGGWIESGHVLPLDSIEGRGAGYWKPLLGRFLETTREAMTHRGLVYGLPLNFKVLVMVYNRKLVPEPPRTTEQLEKLAAERTSAARGAYGLAYCYDSLYYHAAILNAFVPPRTGSIVDSRHRPRLDTPAHVASLDLVRRWALTDRILPPEPTTALVRSLFNAGRAAIVFEGPWFLSDIAPGIQYGLAPLPSVNEAQGQPMRPWLTVEGVFVSARSSHPKEAFAIAKFLTGTQAATILALEGRQSPANKGVYDHPTVSADAVLRLFYDQVQVAVPMSNEAAMASVWSPADLTLKSVFSGREAPRQALDLLQKSVEDALLHRTRAAH